MPAQRKTMPRTARKKRAAATKTGKAARAQRKAAPVAAPRAAPVMGEAAPRRTSPITMQEILHPGAPAVHPDFRDAPEGWTPAHAQRVAAATGLKLTEDHWEVIRVLQGCYKDEATPRLRLLRDALEARFAAKGGVKYLYEILRGGPIVQGCALAGLKPPATARDASFGSVA